MTATTTHLLLVRARADRLPWRSGVAQACVTSPPYWGLRRYGDHPDELGTEDLHIYLSRLVGVFREVRRVLRSDGLAWVNIADTYAGSGGAGGDYLIPSKDKRARRRAPIQRRDYRQAQPTVWRPNGTYGEVELDVLADGQRCNIPGRLATALQDDGWRLRSVIIWAKTSARGQTMARPEDLAHANRPGVSSETILLLAPGPGRSAFEPACLTERGDVWHIGPVTGRYRGPAPYPDELARRCITPSTVRGDLVIDPFHGSGTTGRVARALGRRYAGTDLYTHPQTGGRPIVPVRTETRPGLVADGVAQLDLFGGAA